MTKSKKQTKRRDSTLEREFDFLLATLAPDLPKPQKNYRFDEPDSKMEIDRFWVEVGVGVELNGGTWARGKQGHNSGTGLERDYRKLAAAHRRGIILFFFSVTMIRRTPDWCIAQILPYFRRTE